jgi:hypothetical protein
MATFCLGSAEAAAASSWSVEALPAPAVVHDGELSGVSCPSRTFCFAVGSYTDSSGNTGALVERWNGSRWTVQPTPNARGATLAAVSCTSRTFCMALGTAASDSGIAERWNGRGWSTQKFPIIGDTGDSVSCSSRRACLAAAGDGVERWDGRRWSQARLAFRDTWANGFVNSVSCSSANACTVVGSFDLGGCSSETPCNEFPLVERWDGTRWSIEPTVNHGGGANEGLNDVSCTSATACTAVGSFGGGIVAERWDGASWSVEPIAKGARNVVLAHVSCASGKACLALGNSLVERWNGSRWSIQRPPHPADSTGSTLSDVSCTAKAVCTMVGGYTNTAGEHLTLAERWRRFRWSVQSTPNAVVDLPSQLNGVSCTSPSACTAVGTYTDGAGNSEGLAERWDGTSWTIENTPEPTTVAALDSVACATATACMALASSQTATERWDGTSWTIQNTPNVPSASLSGVSCTSATACTAVGSYANSAGQQVTLAERWDGTSWTIQNTPNPAGATSSVLGAVSCTSETACTALGSYGDTAGIGVALVERWDGTSWTIQNTPNAPSAGLSGVSCTSATACTAVGSSEDSAYNIMTLVERWDGTSWTIQNTPNPAGATSSVLGAVSCTSETACTAVGSYGDGTTNAVALAERWDGTSWTIQNAPKPSGATGMTLSGVSCTSAVSCTAVGQFSTSPPGVGDAPPYLVVEKYS